MIHGTEIAFRGNQREVEFEHEGDGVIVWWFPDEGICGGADTSDSEQDAVYQQLWTYLSDYWTDYP